MKKLKKRHYIAMVKALGKALNIKVKLIKYTTTSFAYVEKNKVEVSIKSRTAKGPLCRALHEFCHVLCYREGKFKKYHNWGTRNPCTPNSTRAMLRTALRAERYVDERAEKMCNTLFPNVKYQRAYRVDQPKHIIFLHKYYQKYRDFLKEKRKK